jgi:hypothetical protein
MFRYVRIHVTSEKLCHFVKQGEDIISYKQAKWKNRNQNNRLDLDRTYQLVLICSHGGENCLGEDVGTKLFALQINNRPSGVTFHSSDEVHSWLVTMHRI